MIDLKAAHRYARAFFQLSDQRSELQTIDQDFIKLCGLLDKHPEISHLVLNSTISRVEKEDFIDKVMGQDISKLLINFVKLLIRKKRFDGIRSIQKEFHSLYEKKKGIQEVVVVTAVPLSPSNEEKLKSVLKKKLHAEIRLVAEIDPAMIGGIILRMAGKEINTSFQGRLFEIRQKLMS